MQCETESKRKTPNYRIQELTADFEHSSLSKGFRFHYWKTGLKQKLFERKQSFRTF